MNLRIRLTHKIAAIGVIGILGLAIVGGFYLSGSWTQARSQKNADDANALAMLTSKLSIQMLQARRAEKNFLLRHDDQYAKNHDEAPKAPAPIMDDISQRLTVLNQIELAQKLTAARADYDIYVKHFKALVDTQLKIGLTENDGLQRALRKSVDEVEAEIKKFSDSKLEAGMLTMRRHEKNYMLRQNTKYGDELKDAAISFTGDLFSSNLPAEYQTAITQKLEAYQRDFLAYMDGSQASIRATKALSDAYTKFDPQIMAIEKAIDTMREDATSTFYATAASTTLEIQIVILVAAIGVILLGFVIGRSITRPLTAVTPWII